MTSQNVSTNLNEIDAYNARINQLQMTAAENRAYQTIVYCTRVDEDMTRRRIAGTAGIGVNDAIRDNLQKEQDVARALAKVSGKQRTNVIVLAAWTEAYA